MNRCDGRYYITSLHRLPYMCTVVFTGTQVGAVLATRLAPHVNPPGSCIYKVVSCHGKRHSIKLLAWQRNTVSFPYKTVNNCVCT